MILSKPYPVLVNTSEIMQKAGSTILAQSGYHIALIASGKKCDEEKEAKIQVILIRRC